VAAPNANAVAVLPEDAIARVVADPGKVRPVVQPIVDVPRGVVAGYEALARFDDQVAATPDVWFASARFHGLGPAFERAVLQRVLRLRPSVPANCFLTVNVEPDHLVDDAVLDLLLGVPLAGLVVELTEHAFLDDMDRLHAATERLRGAGALVAVDDAGSGYAGLQQVLAIRPDLVKLDRELVRDVDGG
jgi:EAL domain-containing protein (putative c-di-GMP-specific phosphodiesterase class I)